MASLDLSIRGSTKLLYPFDHAFLVRVANRIINEVRIYGNLLAARRYNAGGSG